MKSRTEMIIEFLNCREFAVVGASTNRTKFGNQVLRHYLRHGKTVYPIHPKEAEIEGCQCFPSLSAAPRTIEAISIITPPPVTEMIVREAIELGIRKLWMQPGAESPKAIAMAEDAEIDCIAGEACVLIELR